MNPFDFVNSISYNKEDLFVDPQAEKDYAPFLVNRALSYFPDTIMYANAVNQFSGNVPKKWQYDFLREAIPKRKRFSKWAKRETSDDLTTIQMYYKYSQERAMEVLSILSKEQIEYIKQQMDKGGKS